MKLKNEMKKLVEWTRARMIEKGYDSDSHHTLFHEVATEFDLYASDGQGNRYAPIWLSRVVAGIIQDGAEGEGV